MKIPRDKLVEIYRMMQRIRQFELKAVELFTQGALPGFLHSCLGEEGSAVGACANLTVDDYITSTHRGHGHVIAKGARLDRMMAELYARETGYCRGKGGSMHIMDLGLNILGANGIVGAGLPIANGAGLSAKLRGTDQVVICFFGDGASNTGAFHEALNLASAWSLPVIYVCENNLYAESTHQKMHQKVRDVAVRAAAYDIPGSIVDGNNVFAVYETVGQAVRRARAGDGPSLVECKTYRWLGHYVGDPGVYRTKEEVDQWMLRDPLNVFRERDHAEGSLSEGELSVIEAEVRVEVEEAVKFAESSPSPALETALEDVFFHERAAGG